MEELIKCDSNSQFFDKDNNFSVYAFITIEDLIENSSHDKQNKLMDLLVAFVLKLKNLRQKSKYNRGFRIPLLYYHKKNYKKIS